MFNQDALFKGYKKRLEKLPKAKPGSEATRMVSDGPPLPAMHAAERERRW